jgi:hypothetical protein
VEAVVELARLDISNIGLLGCVDGWLNGDEDKEDVFVKCLQNTGFNNRGLLRGGQVATQALGTKPRHAP